MSAPVLCPDCGRVKASSRALDEWEAFEDVDCFADYEDNVREGLTCKRLTIACLRSQLEALRAAAQRAFDEGVRAGLKAAGHTPLTIPECPRNPYIKDRP